MPEPGLHEAERVERHEIVFPTAGLYVREIAGRREHADATRVVFGNAGDCYRVHHPVPGGDRCTVITLGPGLVEAVAGATGAMAAAPGDPRFPLRSRGIDGRLYAMHRRVVRLHAGGAADRLEVDERVFQVVHLAIAGEHARPGAGGAPRRGARRVRDRALARAIEVVHLRFRERLSLDDVGREAGYSPFHLARLFRSHTGLPVHQYVNRLRLRAAFEAVLDGPADLSAVALSHGFSSHSHFTAAFGREFGIAPSAARAGYSRLNQRDGRLALSSASRRQGT
ncbi:MAG TPA: helix-turn-helix transcriptional regulator [Longimicrobiaceae bacterium]|nr:helix-turn-helix transcriptional regulator [Longimicrobiaceae bacterium]